MLVTGTLRSAYFNIVFIILIIFTINVFVLHNNMIRFPTKNLFRMIKSVFEKCQIWYPMMENRKSM